MMAIDGGMVQPPLHKVMPAKSGEMRQKWKNWRRRSRHPDARLRPRHRVWLFLNATIDG